MAKSNSKKQTGKPRTTSRRSSKKTTAQSSRSSRSKTTTSSRSKKRSSRSKASSSRSRSTSKPSPKKKQSLPTLTTHQRALLGGISLIFLTAILILSLVAPEQGQLTRALADGMRVLFGWGSVLLPLFLGGAGVYLILWGMEHPPTLPVYRLFGVLLLFVALGALATLFVVARNNGVEDVWLIAQQRRGGGYFGGLLAWLLIGLIGSAGAALIFMLIGVLGAILVSGVSRADLAGAARSLNELPATVREATRSEQAADESVNEPSDGLMHDPPIEVADAPAGAQLAAGDDRRRALRIRERYRQGRKRVEEDNQPAVTPSPAATVLIDSNGRAKGEWELPSMTTMLKPGMTPEAVEETIEEQAAVIEHTLESFGAPGQIVDINSGPTVTQFGVEPLYLESRSGRRMKVKVSKIAGLADDLALALAAKSVRIQAPVPGKGYIGIEVPNTAKVVVSLRDVMESHAFAKIGSPLRLGLGQDVAGHAIAADLAKMPHLLIAGATGSGKSVCVNSIIACLLLQCTPEQLRFVMVDPKRVELTGYNGIPHLAAPVVVEMDRVIGVLQWALREMDARYQLFANSGTRNIISYNKHAERVGRDNLPYIVIIIDELADLMMTSPEETERALARLAQMARATGIHMIISTQRPSVDVVTGLIKANFPARIAFAVSSAIDSRVILDSTGAERLLGAGDMLLQKPDAPGPMRMQGCWVSDGELNNIIGYWQRARRFHRYTADDAAAKPTVAEPVTVRKAPTATEETASAAAAESRPAEAAPTDRTAADGNGDVAAPIARSTPKRAPTKAVRGEQPDDELELPGEQAQTLTPISQTQAPLWEHLIAQEQKRDDQVDELWEETVAYVREVNKASTSMLQRRFRIGYTRAARIIDAMEEQGIIGPPTGTSKAREVLPAD